MHTHYKKSSNDSTAATLIGSKSLIETEKNVKLSPNFVHRIMLTSSNSTEKHKHSTKSAAKQTFYPVKLTFHTPSVKQVLSVAFVIKSMEFAKALQNKHYEQSLNKWKSTVPRKRLQFYI